MVLFVGVFLVLFLFVVVCFIVFSLSLCFLKKEKRCGDGSVGEVRGIWGVIREE